MTAIFWGNETRESAPHIQHFAENITYTLKCQCKKKMHKRVKNNWITCTASKRCCIHYITLQLPHPFNYTRFFFSIYSPPQYQVVYNTMWTAELPGGCVPWCAYIGNSFLCWSEVQCQKNWNSRNWTASAISRTNNRKIVDQCNCSTQWFQVGASQIEEWQVSWKAYYKEKQSCKI